MTSLGCHNHKLILQKNVQIFTNFKIYYLNKNIEIL